MPRSSRPNRKTLPALLGLFLSLLWLRAASGARAEDAERSTPQLTSRGRRMVSGAVGGSWSSDHSGSVGVLKTWNVYASPSLICFLRDRIGLGLSLSGGASETNYGSPGSYRTFYRDSDLFVGVTGAFDLPLSTRFSLLVEPALGYAYRWRKTPSVAGSPGASDDPEGDNAVFSRPLHLQALRASLDAQFLVRLSPYVALGMGPGLWTDIVLDDGGLRKAQARYRGERAKQRHLRTLLGLSARLLISF